MRIAITRCSTMRFGAALACVVLWSSTVAALPRCSEGRTISGECVNPLLAQVQRRDAIINAQPRISMTAPLNLPSEDSFYPVVQTLNEPNTYIAPTTVTPFATLGGTILRARRTGPILYTPGSVGRRY